MTLSETIKCSSSVLPFSSPFPSSVLKLVSGTETVGRPMFRRHGGLEQGVGTWVGWEHCAGWGAGLGRSKARQGEKYGDRWGGWVWAECEGVQVGGRSGEGIGYCITLGGWKDSEEPSHMWFSKSGKAQVSRRAPRGSLMTPQGGFLAAAQDLFHLHEPSRYVEESKFQETQVEVSSSVFYVWPCTCSQL